MTQEERGAAEKKRRVRSWLLVTCALIVLMVAVGGITRLTHSGLSIVEWKPIAGSIPPLSQAAWEELFTKYQQTPQYRIQFSSMTLDEFKGIFFWEFVHRLLGRVIGIVFIPWGVWLLLRGAIAPNARWKFYVAAFLGGAQGALGWFMVKSGLVDRPLVSHYRLAAHLSLALLVLVFLFVWWLSLGDRRPSPRPSRRLQKLSSVFLGVLGVQIVYGAFTAGLRAGHMWNSWPLMNGAWLPNEAWLESPLWLNFLSNPTMVQFVHRGLAYALVALSVALWVAAWRELGMRSSGAATWLLGFTLLQVCLGIATLLTRTPVSLGTVHQVVACGVLLAAVRLRWMWASGAVGQDLVIPSRAAEGGAVQKLPPR